MEKNVRSECTKNRRINENVELLKGSVEGGLPCRCLEQEAWKEGSVEGGLPCRCLEQDLLLFIQIINLVLINQHIYCVLFTYIYFFSFH